MKSENSGNPLVYLFRETWRHSEGHHGKVVCYWVLLILGMGFSLIVEPLLLAKIISIVVSEGVTESNLKQLFGLLGLFILCEVVFWALHGPARVIECVNSFRVRASYRKHLLSGIMALPIKWHIEHHSGDTIDKVGKGSGGLHDFAENSFQVIYLGVRLIVSYTMLAWFSVPSALIALLMTGVAFYIATKFDDVLIKQQVELNKSENSIAESIQDAITNIMTTIVLRAEKNSFGKISHKLDEPLPLARKRMIVVELKWFTANMCCAIMLAMVLGTYFYQHVGATAGVLASSVYLLMNYLVKIGDVFYEFNAMYGDIVKHRTQLVNAEEITREFKDKETVEQHLPDNWQVLSIKDLDFSYHDKDGAERHLDGVSLSIERGERLAFVGITGSGKTTMLKLIRGLHQPSKVELSVDGAHLERGFASISDYVDLIPQSPEIFATTIRENITLGAPCDAHTIQRFTDMACFSEVVGALPKGLESTTREKGVNLSGGQQQRLALARGLLAARDCDILLLDEPTSSLDAATERRVYQNIFRGFLGKTVISTVHRLHLLPHFDKIFLFEEGKIIASGTLAELLATSPEFQHMWEKGQAEVALTA